MTPAPEDTSPSWQLRRVNGCTVLVLGGDWIARSGRIPEFSIDRARSTWGGDMLAFDTTHLGRWDSGLIAFLWDAKRAAVSTTLTVDGSSLPEAARKMLALLPDRMVASSLPRRRAFRPFNWLGGVTLGMLAALGELSQLLAATVGAHFGLLARRR